MGLTVIEFDDDTFGVNREYMRSLCEKLRTECPGLRWSCEIHVKLVDDATIAAMKRAGCYAISIGIESGNNEMLKLLRKNITIEQALSACRTIRRHGIEVRAFFIIGFPLETEETLRDTVEAMKRAECDTVVFSIFTPYPGTETYDLCLKLGLIGDDYDISIYNHQSPLNCFCKNIPRDRFREHVREIGRIVDRKNAINRIKQVFSSTTVHRIRQMGFGSSFRKALQVFSGR
jgi:anaerobic magnesium-protoporphyrin IX monomethyl ester cyclase